MPLAAATVDGPLGPLRLIATERGLRFVRFDPGRWPVEAPDPGVPPVPAGSSPVLDVAVDLLTAYFEGEHVTFDLPLDLSELTPFHGRVVTAMRGIPYGELATYGDLARQIGEPGAARAVGGACNNNPLPIVVPCHRVVAADGSLGGYAAGVAAKRELLLLERGVAVPPGGWEPRAARDRPDPGMPRLFEL